MNKWEYTYIWWEGSTTATANGQLGQTTPPIGKEVMDKLNTLGAEGWEIDHVAAAPITTGWIGPRGGTAAAGFTDKVHYLAMLRCSVQESNAAADLRERFLFAVGIRQGRVVSERDVRDLVPDDWLGIRQTHQGLAATRTQEMKGGARADPGSGTCQGLVAGVFRVSFVCVAC